MKVLLNIGFLPFGIFDVLDILIVGYVFFLIYRLLRGSIAFNIFIGIVMLYVVWWIVDTLNMDLLSLFLGQFMSVGVLLFIIIFQPEVRKFLLLIGNTGLSQRFKFINKFFDGNLVEDKQLENEIKAIKGALLEMAKSKTGALLVFTKNMNHEYFGNSGVILQAKVTQQLLLSIFQKESPLHDGAVIIANNLIQNAGAILPVSNNNRIPKKFGLRHRSAIGVTEVTSAFVLIVSEETGDISYAFEGKLVADISEGKLDELLKLYY